MILAKPASVRTLKRKFFIPPAAQHQGSFSLESLLTRDKSIPRRPSSGAQHSGRGGAGNVFKDKETELTRKLSNDEAITDEEEPKSANSPTATGESLAQKGKNWLFGKKA